MQCPRCGQEVPEIEAGACARCHSEGQTFLEAPDVVDRIQCVHCGSVQDGELWQRTPSDHRALILSTLESAVEVDDRLEHLRTEWDIRWEDERNASVSVRIAGQYRGHPVERAANLRVRIKNGACPECSRFHAGYYEAILQVRADHADVMERERNHILSHLEQQIAGQRDQQRAGAFVSRLEDVRGGLDYYVGNVDVARQAAQSLLLRYGADLSESKKTVGRKDGRDLYRVTVLVRLPAYLPGDFIEFDGRAYKVLRRDRKLVALWDLERNLLLNREPRRAHQIRVIGRREDEKDAVVISYHSGQLQLLDPTTFKTLDLHLEGNFKNQETVRIFRHEERVFVLPLQAQSVQAKA